MSRTLDSIDLRILKLVQSDARLPNAEVARNLGMAPSAIHQRIRRLEESGAIQSYVARIDPAAVDRSLLSFIHVRTDESLGSYDVAAALSAVPGVLEVHDIAGEDCYLMKVRAADTADLHRFLREDLAAIKGVLNTRTTIVLKTICERVDLPIPEAQESAR